MLEDWQFYIIIFTASFLLFLIFQITLVWYMKRNAKKNGETYEFGKMKIVGLALLAAIFLTVTFVIFDKVGILGIIVIIGLPGALIFYLKK